MKRRSKDKKILTYEERKYAVSIIFLSAIILFSLVISGCGSRDPTALNIYTGTQGVTVEFTQNNPPQEIYEDSAIILMAEVWNRGAYTPGSKQTPVIYVSVNVDDLYFTLNEGNYEANILPLYLEGKSQVWPVGEKTITIAGKLNTHEILGTRESPQTKIELSACYPYKTYFSESICVDTDIYSLEKNPICRNQKVYSYPSGQGAPIIVSRIDVDMVPVGVESGSVSVSQPVTNSAGQLQDIGHGTIEGKDIIIAPNFRIYFRNTDKGVILAFEEGVNPCVDGPSGRGEVIKLNATLGNTVLNCTKPEIQMYSNEGSVRCFLPPGNVNGQFELNRNYELPLRIEAEYFYKTTTVKNVEIVRVS